jgi:hypothetical protein
MSKVVLNDISNITGNPTSAEQTINANFQAIEEAIENTLSRDGTLPNALTAALDANSQRIINLPYALSESEAVPLGQVYKLVTGEDWTGIGIPAVVYYQDNEPTATAVGQVWVQLDGTMWIWNGSGWVLNSDPNLAAVIAQSSANTAAINTLDPRVFAVEQDMGNVNQAIIELTEEDVTLAGTIDTVTADLGDLSAVVQSETYARVAGDNALAATINTLQASNAQIFIQAGEPVPGVGGVPDPIPEGSFWYDNDDDNHQYRYLDGSWQSVENGEVAALTAVIQAEEVARIDGDSALASDITNLWAQRNLDSARVTQVEQASTRT